MGKSLPRTCKGCNTKLKKNFNDHLKICKKEFKGWIFWNKDGVKTDVDSIPYRKNRVVGKDGGEQIKRNGVTSTPT